MYQNKRAKAWEKRGGGRRVEPPMDPSLMSIIQDDFVPHPTTAFSVDVAIGHDQPVRVAVDRIWTVIRENRLVMVNYGFGSTDEFERVKIIVTFKTAKEAAVFRMFWMD